MAEDRKSWYRLLQRPEARVLMDDWQAVIDAISRVQAFNRGGRSARDMLDEATAPRPLPEDATQDEWDWHCIREIGRPVWKGANTSD